MSRSYAKNGNVHAYTGLMVIKIQALFLAISLVPVFTGNEYASSLAIGLSIGLLASLIFYIHLFKYRGARQARKILSSMYRGEAVKLIFVALCFFGVFKILVPSYPMLVLIGYIVAQAAYWFAPFLRWNVSNLKS